MDMALFPFLPDPTTRNRQDRLGSLGFGVRPSHIVRASPNSLSQGWAGTVHPRWELSTWAAWSALPVPHGGLPPAAEPLRRAQRHGSLAEARKQGELGAATIIRCPVTDDCPRSFAVVHGWCPWLCGGRMAPPCGRIACRASMVVAHLYFVGARAFYCTSYVWSPEIDSC
jgi:hypothetical protein